MKDNSFMLDFENWVLENRWEGEPQGSKAVFAPRVVSIDAA